MAKKGIKLKVGPNGEIRFPKEALDALDVDPGGDVKLFIDTRRKILRLERHVEDVWAEALQPKEQKDFDDILQEQQKRDQDAADLFDRRTGDAPKEKRKPEEDPDLWR